MNRSKSRFIIVTLAFTALLLLAGIVSGTSIGDVTGAVQAAAPEPITAADSPEQGPLTEEPTAVVLSSFSAKIRGPSRALWVASVGLLAAAFIVVRYYYTRLE